MPRNLLLLVLASVLALSAPTAIHAQDAAAPRLDCFGDPLPAGAVARLGTIRFRNVDRAAYAPDGKIIATLQDGAVIVWDAATGTKIRQLTTGRDLRPMGMIFSHHGRKLAILGWFGHAVQVWDMNTFTQETLVQGEQRGGGGDWSNGVAFSSDDKILFAVYRETVFHWDVASGKKIKEIPLLIQEKAANIRLVAFSPDGKVCATRNDSQMHIWDTQTGQLRHAIDLLGSGDYLKFSRDGKMIVVVGHSHWISLWNVETGKKIQGLSVADRVESTDFSFDGKSLAAASKGGRSASDGGFVIHKWDLTNLQKPPLKFPAPGVDFVAFSPDDKTLAWGCYRTSICFMDPVTGQDKRPVESHTGAIRSLVYSPDGKRLYSAADDGTIRTWDAETGKHLASWSGHFGAVNGLALFPNGKWLASCGEDRTFRLWEVASGKNVTTLEDEGNSVVAAAFSRDGKRLATGGNRGMIFHRDPGTGKVLEEFESARDMIKCLAFSPDGKTLAVLHGYQGDLHLRDIATKKTTIIAAKHSGSSLAYSPDGKTLAVVGNESLLLLDTATNGVLRTLPGHFNAHGCVAFSADSRYLASVSDGWDTRDGHSIRIFEMASGTEIHPFPRESAMYAAAFSPDGSRLAVGGEDATILILDLHNLTNKQRRTQLAANELAARWDSLASTDAAQAYAARTSLLHAPKSALPFLARHLEPAPALDAKRVERLIKSLESEDFKERDEASRELEQLGELVAESMRKTLAAEPPLETRQRLKALLEKLEQYTPTQLRYLRSLEILEGIDTPETWAIIERLSKGNPDGLLTVQSRVILARRLQMSEPLPESPKPQQVPAVDHPAPGPVLTDRDGDPMPPGAIARLGTARWRLANEPRRIILSPDGKRIAVVNAFSGVEWLDARTGRCIERANFGIPSWGYDLRMSVAVSADGRKVAALTIGEKLQLDLAIFERGTTETVKIVYRRRMDAYPVVPEEMESSGRYGYGTFEMLSAIDFSPDGKTLIGAVRFDWDAYGGKLNKEIKENTLTAWDATTGKELWKAPPRPKPIVTILHSSDGKTLTVVDEAGVGFWDAGRGRELRRWESRDPLFSAYYSPDRLLLATGSKDEVLLWDVAKSKVVRRLALPGKGIKAIAFSPDGKHLAAGSDKTIRFWEVTTGKAEGDCVEFRNPVETVAFASDGKTLFSGHREENIVRRWDVASRKPAAEITGAVLPIEMLCFSADSASILASSKSAEGHLWESATGKSLPLARMNDPRFVNDCFGAMGRAALLRCDDRIGLRIAILHTSKAVILEHGTVVLGASVDGQHVLMQSEKDKMPRLTVVKVAAEPANDKEKTPNQIEREIEWKEGNAASAVLSPDGRTVAIATGNDVCFVDVGTGKERRYPHPAGVAMDTVKFSPDGSRVALVGGGTIGVLAVKDGRRIAVMGEKHMIAGLAFAPDGQSLLTTDTRGLVFIWEIATGQKVRLLDKGDYLFSPDNRLLAGKAATAENLSIMDLYSGRILRECSGPGYEFATLAFSPDSQYLAASSSDTTVVVWPTSAVDARAVAPLDRTGLLPILETGSAADAYGAIGRLIADPERALPLLEGRLRPVPRVDAERVRGLIADLDSDQPKRRDAAVKNLVELGPLAEPALRTALSVDRRTPASRERIEKMLLELEGRQTNLATEDVVHIRAIQALERIGTKRARRLLESLAQGDEWSPRTRAAKEALGRMDSGAR